MHMKHIKDDLDKTLKQVSQKLEGGKPMPAKDMEILKDTLVAYVMAEVGCLLHEAKEDPEKLGKKLAPAMGAMLPMIGKMMKGGPQMSIGFDTSGHIMPTPGPVGNETYSYHDMENRRGVPGSGRGRTRSEMDDETEMRRRRDSRGRYAGMDEGMNDHYGPENHQGMPQNTVGPDSRRR